jgi:hypothetical protein
MKKSKIVAKKEELLRRGWKIRRKVYNINKHM